MHFSETRYEEVFNMGQTNISAILHSPVALLNSGCGEGTCFFHFCHARTIHGKREGNSY